MIIDLRTHGFSPTPALNAHVERRLGLALDRWAERIARVRVTVRDLNGPRGGADKRCRVEIRLRGGGSVRAAAVDADAYAAIGAASRGAARALARALQRERATTLELLWLARVMSRSPSAA